MGKIERCKRCGGAIPSDAPGGECPACLLESALHFSDTDWILSLSPPFTLEALAKIFPQLEVLEIIGQGGMGVVYKARQRSLDRIVALKILPRDVAMDPSFAERFTREAKAMAKLNHPNIISIYSSDQAEGLYYFIMEYVDGVDLSRAKQMGMLSPKMALSVVSQICDALQYAHDQGVVHRDIKPANILLGRGGQVKIADFGLAKLLHSTPEDFSLTGERQVMGTIHYMAPEQIQSPKDVDHRADIYSLGVVFYEMLTGELPLGHFPPPSKKVQIDVRLDRVVLRALEQEREQRYQRAEQVKTDVHSIESGVDETEQEAKMSYPAPERRLSKMAVVGVLGFPTAIIAGILVDALGAGPHASIVVFLAVTVAGVFLSGSALAAIRSDPERLTGRGLALAGVFIPLFLSPLWAMFSVFTRSLFSVLIGILIIAAPLFVLIFFRDKTRRKKYSKRRKP